MNIPLSLERSLAASLLLLLVLFTAAPARAQVELIVRLNDEADGPLAQVFDPARGLDMAKADASTRALLGAVQKARAVFPQAAKKAPRGSRARPQRAYTLQVPDSSALQALRAQLEARPEVAYAQPNRLYRIQRGPAPAPSGLHAPASPRARASAPPTSNDPYLDSLSHFPVVRVPEAWDVTTGSEEVKVGIVDTGLFFEHPDLQGQVWINPGEDLNGNGVADPSDFNGVDDDGNGFADDIHGYDFVDRPGLPYTGDYTERDPDPSHDRADPASILGNRHGTNVAGVVGAARDNGVGIAGAAPGTRLVPLRAFGGDGAGADDDIAAAIVYAADLGVDVLNFSFGDVYYSPIMEEAVQYAAAQGVVMAASAGNGGGQHAHYPSDYPEVISTAQLAVRLDAGDFVISFPGTYGTGLDLSAPGDGIYTTNLPREGGPGAPPEDLYTRVGGSSFAAPQVAATAALLRSRAPDLSPEAIRAIITASAEDIEAEGWDHRSGAGLLDVASAVRRALPARTEITQPESDGGFGAGPVAVTGTAIDPSFRSYSVYYAEGDSVGFGEGDLAWTRIAGPFEEQVLDDTLAVWDTESLPDSLYTLRLATRLQDGSTVEERRRVYLDRTPPQIDVQLLSKGLLGEDNGVLADVRTDDLTEVQMRVALGGRTYTATSDRRARRHGLRWADARGDGGAAHVTLEATNAAGQTATYETDLTLPRNRMNTSLFSEEQTGTPAGYLLPEATDFDGDGLDEIGMTEFADGVTTDTLSFFEWDGEGFALAHQLFSFLFMRDAGDTNGDGREELLMDFQGARATLLVEQADATTYPDFGQIAFIDTTGLELGGTAKEDSIATANSVNGALLTDLDSDGRGEILSTNTRDEWRILERSGNSFDTVDRVENPTDRSAAILGETSKNAFQVPQAATGDFDGDGRRAFLAGDADGDVMLFEARADGTFEPVFTHETRRYGAGSRFATGDFDGDGDPEFVTYTRPFLGENQNNERPPRFGSYSVWDATGDDTYRLLDRFLIDGIVSTTGAMQTADFDGDGRPELIVAHPPALYVLTYDEAGGFAPVFRRESERLPLDDFDDERSSNAVVTPALVAHDFDDDATPEIVAAALDGTSRRLVYRRAAAERPPPRWVQAAATDAQRVSLEWRAAGADSVRVFRGPPGRALDPYRTTPDSVLADTAASSRRYALRAFYGGEASPLSETRTVRPEAAATVAEVAYPAPQVVRLRFTRRLAPDTRAAQFVFEGASGVEKAPAGRSFGEGGQAVALRFKGVAGRSGTLRWSGVESADGVPVAQTSVGVAFPEAPGGDLIVKDWDVLDGTRVVLTFSEPVEPSFASDASNYTVTAPGEVAGASVSEEAPARVVVEIAGLRIGPTGRENALTVRDMRGQSGAKLAAEGQTIRLSEAAEDLSNVYVYPNPYHAGRHDARVTVAGLPAEASVQVLSVQGTMVKELDERGSDGGLDWDLTDRNGEAVPAGVYLIRVDAPEASPVLKKAAVIR